MATGPFDVNLSIVFRSLPFLERFQAAASAGFSQVEFWWPESELDRGLSVDDVVMAVRSAGVKVSMFNFDGGDLSVGDRGLAGDPLRVDRFRANVPVALELASRIGCRNLNALAGKRSPDIPEQDQAEILRESIAYAADLAARSGAHVLLEPLNAAENPNYLLPDSPTALRTIEALGLPNVLLQLDVYHVVMAGEDPLRAIADADGRLGHVQLADVPGRHEPGTGKVDFDAVLRALGEVLYMGAIGLEYVPSNSDAPDFGYLGALQKAAEAAFASV